MGKIIDITNQRFGRLVAIEPLPERKNRQVVWKCQCDCGNITNVVSGALRSGHTQSCGCLQKEKASNNNIDITNQRFGRLVAIEPTEKRYYRHVVWKCKCDCGNIVEVPLNSLRQQKTRSCGCLVKEINKNNGEQLKAKLLNKKFGKLTVIEEIPDIRKNGRIVWKCQCDCGNIIEVPTLNLTSGNTTSCGCIKSKGEQKISIFLQKHNIIFQQQKTFDACRFEDTNRPARFDFYLPEYNLLIEYDGQQHFYYTNSGWNNKENFEKNQQHDNFKNDWCKNNNIKLIRISYLDNIEDKLKQELKIYEN